MGTKGQKLTVSIGGIRSCIWCREPHYMDLLTRRYHHFRSSGPADFHIQVQVGSRAYFLKKGVLQSRSDPPDIEVEAWNGRGLCITQAQKHFWAALDFSQRLCALKTTSNQYYFDSFFCLLYSLLLARAGGILLRASGLSDGQQGHVLLDPSGSGKSIISRLSQGRALLSNGLVVIRPLEGRFYVFATPFLGEFSSSETSAGVLLAGLFFLHESSENRLQPLAQEAAVQALQRCVFFPGKPEDLLDRVWDCCQGLGEDIPTWELRFLPEPSLVRSSDWGAKRVGEPT